ncbi:hypothetical protein M3J09_013021 [Ascochyta lentis]
MVKVKTFCCAVGAHCCHVRRPLCCLLCRPLALRLARRLLPLELSELTAGFFPGLATPPAVAVAIAVATAATLSLNQIRALGERFKQTAGELINELVDEFVGDLLDRS